MSQKSSSSESGRNAAYVKAFTLLEKFHGGDKSVEKEMRDEFARLLKADEHKGPIDGLLCGLVVLEGYDPSIITDAFGDAGDYRRQTLEHATGHAEKVGFKFMSWTRPSVRKLITAYRKWLAEQEPATGGSSGRKGILAFVTEPTDFVCDGTEDHCPAARWAFSERRESGGEAGEDTAMVRAKAEAELERLKAAKSEAIVAEDFMRAGELKAAIAAAEARMAGLDTDDAGEAEEKAVDKTADLKAVITGELERLKKAKSEAVAAEDFVKAGELKAAIAAAEEKLAGLDANGSGSKNTVATSMATPSDTDAELAKTIAACRISNARGALKKLVGRFDGGTLDRNEFVKRVNEIMAR